MNLSKRGLAPYEYACTYPVFRHECDCNGRMQPGGLLRFAQQAGVEQCNQVGITDEVHRRLHTAFVLAKVALHFSRCPKGDEILAFVTQPQKVYHAVNKRLTRVLDEQGKEVALVDSRWVLMDVEKRVLLRTHPPELEGPWADEVLGELPMRIPRQIEAEPVGTVRAGYSRCDANGHLNNTRYADIVCDALPPNVLLGHPVQDMLILYHREIPMGAEFELRRAQTAPNQWYVCGWREERCSFEALLTLGDL